jgi:hypothetical protein
LKITKAGVHIFYTNAAATSKIYLPEGWQKASYILRIHKY